MSGTIALFTNHPKCSVQSCNGIIKALSPKYDFKIFTKHEIEDDFFDDVDAVCFPGGFGDSDSYDVMMKQNGKLIRDFVYNGGKYLGVCMGAYWADKDYFNLLQDIRVVQYIKQPNTDTKRPHAKAMKVTWKDAEYRMFFYDGASFNVDGDCDIVSYYPNGDPMAIIQNNIGLIGCHPESQKHWYDSYSWMKKHWHDNTQGHLLLDFVDELMEK